MTTYYNAQIDNKKEVYSIQFETGNYDYFKIVEKACRKAVDKRDRKVTKSRASKMSSSGHL